MRENNSWLKLKNIHAYIGNKKVFNGINLQLSHGEHTAILGPNGSGKSALIKLINRSIYPIVRKDSKLIIFGKENIKLKEIREKIGFLSSDIESHIPNNIKIIDIVLSGIYGRFYIKSKDHVSRKDIELTNIALEKLEIQELAHQRYGELSDGQKRRAIIARSIVNKPKILILDEPTSNLDIKARLNLLKLIKTICNEEQTTIIQVTHRSETITENMKRVILLKNGKILGDGSLGGELNSEKLSLLFETNIKVVKSEGYIHMISI